MAQTNFTPIQLYFSTTAAAIPSAGNLANGELAINITDGKIYYKNNAGVVTLFGSSGDLTTISFGSTGLTPSTATGGAVTVAGTLVVGNGGTGLTTLATGSLAYGAGTSAFSTLAIGTAGQILTSSGTVPQWSTLSGVAVTTFSGGTTGLTPSSATSGAITLAGTLNVANGGTGATTLTGVLKGNGTSAFSAATAGTDYVAPGTPTTFTALQTFAGTTSNADLKTSNILEVDTISATAATGTINYDVTTQSVLFYTSNASGNWTVNFRGSSGTTLNTLMQTGESISATFLVTQGSTAYYNSAVTIDGTSVTPKWQGGSAPTSGNASSVDCYTYVIQKTGSATYVVLASQTKFA
jgi:hypothetical protein